MGAGGAQPAMGMAMTVLGMRVYVSNSLRLRQQANGNAPAANSRGTRSVTFVYDPMDLALVQQVRMTETYRLEKRMATGVKGLVNWGTKLTNSTRVQRYIHND